MKAKIKRLVIVILISILLYTLSWLDIYYGNAKELCNWWLLNIPIRIILGFGNALLISILLGLAYVVFIQPIVYLVKWIIKGDTF